MRPPARRSRSPPRVMNCLKEAGGDTKIERSQRGQPADPFLAMPEDPGRWTRRLSHLFAGLITMARIEARMNEVRKGQAIRNRLGRSDARRIARKIKGPRFDIAGCAHSLSFHHPIRTSKSESIPGAPENSPWHSGQDAGSDAPAHAEAGPAGRIAVTPDCAPPNPRASVSLR